MFVCRWERWQRDKGRFYRKVLEELLASRGQEFLFLVRAEQVEPLVQSHQLLWLPAFLEEEAAEEYLLWANLNSIPILPRSLTLLSTVKLSLT